MWIDLEQQECPNLDADVCIVGAGPAGITLARSLIDKGHRVLLLEAGGPDFETDSQAFYAGENTGMPYYPLDHARLRMFGGTLGIWGGRCSLLDSIDFETRSWIPLSGWPFAREELMPHYRAAHDDLGLGPFAYDAASLETRIMQAWQGPAGGFFESQALETRGWRFDRNHERFGWDHCRDLIDDPRCTIVLHANATRVEVEPHGRSVRAIDISSPGGRSMEARGRFYVLACGAIENARLLLDSDDIQPGGLGNHHDQVGRYFMEHPHGRLGRIRTDRPFPLWQALQKQFSRHCSPVAPALVLSASEQRWRKASNGAATLKLQRDPGKGVSLSKAAYLGLKQRLNPNRYGRGLHQLYRDARDWAARNTRGTVNRVRCRMASVQLSVILRAEQVPNPSSRILLSEQRNPLGGRLAKLDWRLSEQDKHSAREMARVFDRELRRVGLGWIEFEEWLGTEDLAWPVDATVSNHPIGGYHHMGTTRMSTNPRLGVVDADSRVHGCNNLYIVGSSVFPTAGWSNPTLTILAMAKRCAAHLDKHLRVMPAIPGANRKNNLHSRQPNGAVGETQKY